MNNYSKDWNYSRGSSSSWDESARGQWRHDARSSDSYYERKHRSDSFYKESKKEKAKKESRKIRRMTKLERESRQKKVDPTYEATANVCRFFSVSKCAHCNGDHYGVPYQRTPIADESNKLTSVQCPIQEHFQWQYGHDEVVRMINEAKVLDFHPTQT